MHIHTNKSGLVFDIIKINKIIYLD